MRRRALVCLCGLAVLVATALAAAPKAAIAQSPAGGVLSEPHRLFLPHLDFRHTCALVLGPVWERAGADERDAFMAAFKTFLINTYATAADELSEWEIRYLPLTLRPGDREALVRTRVLYGGGDPVAVDYRMHRVDGRWLAYDVKAAGIGFVDIFRSSFQPIVRQKGLGGLIADLEAHNAKRLGVSVPTRNGGTPGR